MPSYQYRACPRTDTFRRGPLRQMAATIRAEPAWVLNGRCGTDTVFPEAVGGWAGGLGGTPSDTTLCGRTCGGGDRIGYSSGHCITSTDIRIVFAGFLHAAVFDDACRRVYVGGIQKTSSRIRHFAYSATLCNPVRATKKRTSFRKPQTPAASSKLMPSVGDPKACPTAFKTDQSKESAEEEKRRNGKGRHCFFTICLLF